MQWAKIPIVESPLNAKVGDPIACQAQRAEPICRCFPIEVQQLFQFWVLVYHLEYTSKCFKSLGRDTGANSDTTNVIEWRGEIGVNDRFETQMLNQRSVCNSMELAGAMNPGRRRLV